MRVFSRIVSSSSVLGTLSVLLFFSSCQEDVGDPYNPHQSEKWKIFTKANTAGGLVSDAINDIYIDGANVKWFATDDGASSFSRAGWKVYSEELMYSIQNQGTTVQKKKVNALIGTKDGSMWFCLDGGGVRRRLHVNLSQGVRWFTYTTKDSSLSYNVVRDVAIDSAGSLWFANYYGLSRCFVFTNTTSVEWVNYYPTEAGLSTNFLTSCAVHPLRGDIWIGTLYDEIFAFDRYSRWTAYRNPYGFSPINYIALDDSNFAGESNFLWAGTDDGMLQFSVGSRSNWKKYTVESTNGGLPSNHVRAILSQKNGTLWVATEGGLAQFRNGEWKTYVKRNSPLPNNFVTSLALDRYENLWIGTRGGVAVFNELGIIGRF